MLFNPQKIAVIDIVKPHLPCYNEPKGGGDMDTGNKLFAFDKAFHRGQMRLPSAEIRQIAELSVIMGGEIREHIQTCDEITYAVSGSAVVCSGEREFEMTAGQIHYIRQGEYHKITASETENFRYICIGFLPNTACGSIRGFLNAVKDRKDFVVEDRGDIHTLFSMLLGEVYARDESSDDMIHFYFCQMLILLCRILSGKIGEKPNKINAATTSHAVYQALRYMDKEYLHIGQVKEVADALSYSEYYLSHEFREKMGITMKEYLMQKKILMSAGLLENSNMSVTDISEQVRFASPHSFSQAFRRYMGVSPSQYRENVQKQ